MTASLNLLENAHEFVARHIGLTPQDEARMLHSLGVATRGELMAQILPNGIERQSDMDLPEAVTEAAALAELRAMAGKNQIFKSFIGQGYAACHTPGVILRNVLENPAWYTAYTPYQAEISQGRMEALVNFQTMVTDLTAMPIANASMLDEATAAAEAMTLARRSVKSRGQAIVVSADVHPQILEVMQTRAQPLGLQIKVARHVQEWQQLVAEGDCFAALVQYPASSGALHDWSEDAARLHAQGAALIVCADLLALTLLKPPGEMGADIVVGNSQRLGMPMANGGPHAAYLACRDEYKRAMPGRLVGVSVDAHGNVAYRLALQTREQHIRREKATSNICTAQVLPAVVASMYAVYHGPQGLQRIAQRVATYTAILAQGLAQLGWRLAEDEAHGGPGVFDTLRLQTGKKTGFYMDRALEMGLNLRACREYMGQSLGESTAESIGSMGQFIDPSIGPSAIGISLDETTTREDIALLWRVFAPAGAALPSVEALASDAQPLIPAALRRSTAFLTHPVFNTHHSETGMLRYIRQLADKDLALDRSMIPLGSCTMKLNATSEMIPVTWPEFAHIHPFAPAAQRQAYAELESELCRWLCQVTGYAGVSLQPNAGSQGEYAGLLAIAAHHRANGQAQRNICLIPASAHGTNPASAQMVGMQVVVVACDEQGNVDMADLQAQCEKHSNQLAAVMITYPSTHGVFETAVKDLCDLVHRHGGRVYVDGANMNALVGLAAPGEFGGDVSHLNLHKTFCIPHGGGGPGVGPVCVVQDLVPYLPGHATAQKVWGGEAAAGNVGATEPAPGRPKQAKAPSGGSEAHAVASVGATEPAPGRPKQAKAPSGGSEPRAAGSVGVHSVGAISSAPLGNAAVLPISWMYIRMMGAAGLKHATEAAILSANYISTRLKDHYPTLYASAQGRVAHECILDLRHFKESCGVMAEDVAKRLMDYGFHAPTLSFPVPNTLMVEPTESENLDELERFVAAMIAIRQEIAQVEQGLWPRDDNPLKNAPHTAACLLQDDWTHPYSRACAAAVLNDKAHAKYWPSVGRVDNVYGDRHLFCTCAPVQDSDIAVEASH